jgi:hypothetical protein
MNDKVKMEVVIQAKQGQGSAGGAVGLMSGRAVCLVKASVNLGSKVAKLCWETYKKKKKKLNVRI